jgi:5-methylcytosine-specific restriction endonuclease McrA/predicted nucleic acid-binding Zn ribbon protein
MSQPEAGVSCAHCGAPIMGKQLRYCSPSCRNKAKGVRQYDPAKRQTRYLTKGFGTRTCDVCGETYTATYADQRTCGRLCGQIMRRMNMGQPLSCEVLHGQYTRLPAGYYGEAKGRTCERCGVEVGKYKHLCEDCQPPEVEVRWNRVQYARARRAGVPYEWVDRPAVYERDQWACQICGDAIDRDALPGTTSESASIDHVIPPRKGGPHAMSNVQASHLSCNGKKGDRVIGAA